MFQENSIETCILSRVKQITGPGWMHETSARTWCSGKTWRERVEREVGGGIGMGKTCEPKAFSFQCMTKFTTNKKEKKRQKNVICFFFPHHHCSLKIRVQWAWLFHVPGGYVWTILGLCSSQKDYHRYHAARGQGLQDRVSSLATSTPLCTDSVRPQVSPREKTKQ